MSLLTHKFHSGLTAADVRIFSAVFGFMVGTPLAASVYYDYVQSKGLSPSFGTTITAGYAGGAAASVAAYAAPPVFAAGCLAYAGYSVYQEVTSSEKLV